MIKKILDGYAIFFQRKISFMGSNFTLFVSFVQWWLRLSSNEHKTMLISWAIRVFYLPFGFSSGQSYLRVGEPCSTRQHLRKMRKIVDISNLQATNELIYVIKWLDMYLAHHTNGNNKVNHIVGNQHCKKNVHVYQLFRMNCLVSIF